jgi:hypothetical protein
MHSAKDIDEKSENKFIGKVHSVWNRMMKAHVALQLACLIEVCSLLTISNA